MAAVLLAACGAAPAWAARIVPDAEWRQEGFDPADSRGLFVGVRTFQDRDITPVPYAVDDAVDLAHLFTAELGLVRPQRVTLCLAGQPEKQASRERLAWLDAQGAHRCSAGVTELYAEIERVRNDSGPNGLAVVALASHGFSRDGADVLVAADSRFRFLKDTGLSLTRLLDEVSQSIAPRRLVLIDACRERLESTNAVGQDPESVMGPAFVEALEKARGTAVLMATVLGGYSYNDSRREAGVFTAAVVDGLSGEAPADSQGLITVSELADYVDGRVKSWVERNRPQDRAKSHGITRQLDGSAARLPLAVAPEAFARLEEYRQRRDGALAHLRQHIGPRISGAFYDEVAKALAADQPSNERMALVDAVHELDDGELSARGLIAYFEEHRSRLEEEGTRPLVTAVTSPGLRPGSLWTEPVSNIKFRYIPGGTFEMGSPETEPGRDADEILHQVTLSRGFWMGETEVTQAQWKSLMGNNPSRFSSCGADCPVEQVSWYEAVAFANALSKKAGLEPCYEVSGGTGKKAGEGLEYDQVRFRGLGCRGYRLPTEAEWEYAARAGKSAAIYTGKLTLRGLNDGPELDPIAWYGGNSGVSYAGGWDCSGWEEKQNPASKTCGPHPVGGKTANDWELHDMLGNVWEWTWDWFGAYPASTVVDPLGADTGSNRVFRGGGWNSGARVCRSAYRGGGSPGLRGDDVGFRLVRTP